MRLLYLIAIISQGFYFSSCVSQNSKKMNNVKPPRAKKLPHKLVENGNVRIDNYYWMNQWDNPDVLDYLNAENTYTREMMKPLDSLKEKLFKEMKGRIKENDESVPYF